MKTNSHRDKKAVLLMNKGPRKLHSYFENCFIRLNKNAKGKVYSCIFVTQTTQLKEQLTNNRIMHWVLIKRENKRRL